MKTPNSKTKQINTSSYTYLTSNNIKSYVNTFLYDSAEKEILNDLTKLFQKFGKIDEYESILRTDYNVKLNYKKFFPNNQITSDFKMKSQLQKYFKTEHFKKSDVSKFWLHFVFGFNSISRKIEKGIKFDFVLIDKSLEDAPILGHLRELSTVSGNSDLKMAVFESEKLKEAVNTDSKRFGKVLMVGFMKEVEDTVEILDFKKSFLNKIDSLKFKDVSIIQPQPKAELKEEVLPVIVTNKAVKKCSPYIIDAGHVNLLIATHLSEQIKKREPENKDIDYLCNLKRVKVDIPQTTKFVRPPDQKQKKKIKKAKRKASVDK